MRNNTSSTFTAILCVFIASAATTGCATSSNQVAKDTIVDTTIGSSVTAGNPLPIDPIWKLFTGLEPEQMAKIGVEVCVDARQKGGDSDAAAFTAKIILARTLTGSNMDELEVPKWNQRTIRWDHTDGFTHDAIVCVAVSPDQALPASIIDLTSQANAMNQEHLLQPDEDFEAVPKTKSAWTVAEENNVQPGGAFDYRDQKCSIGAVRLDVVGGNPDEDSRFLAATNLAIALKGEYEDVETVLAKAEVCGQEQKGETFQTVLCIDVE